MKNIAVCPGSFDPVTNGHLDIIKRASKMFDRVIVLVSYNVTKNGGSFTIPERVEMLRKCIHIDNVAVDFYDGLLADYVKMVGASAIIKGLRAVSDFEYEFQQSLINKQLAPDVETVFMVSNQDYLYLSSSVVRQVCFFGGDISPFVPPEIKDEVVERLGRENTKD